MPRKLKHSPNPPLGFSLLEGHESVRRGDKAYDLHLKGMWRSVKRSEIGWVWYAPHFKGFTVFARPNKPYLVRAAYLAEYYDIWRCYYDGSCPSIKQRDDALTNLNRQYPNQQPPQS